MTIYKNVINYIETKNNVEKIEENTNDILARKDNKYKGWKCWSGINCITISSNGDIYNASCTDKKMGNIFKDDQITPLTTPHICGRTWCVCAAHLNLKKVKSNKYLKYVRED